MNLNRYTQRGQEAIMASQELAQSYNHSQIEPEYLLLALLRQEDGVAGEILRQVGVDPGRSPDSWRATSPAGPRPTEAMSNQD